MDDLNGLVWNSTSSHGATNNVTNNAGGGTNKQQHQQLNNIKNMVNSSAYSNANSRTQSFSMPQQQQSAAPSPLVPHQFSVNSNNAAKNPAGSGSHLNVPRVSIAQAGRGGSAVSIGGSSDNRTNNAFDDLMSTFAATTNLGSSKKVDISKMSLVEQQRYKQQQLQQQTRENVTTSSSSVVASYTASPMFVRPPASAMSAPSTTVTSPALQKSSSAVSSSLMQSPTTFPSVPTTTRDTWNFDAMIKVDPIKPGLSDNVKPQGNDTDLLSAFVSSPAIPNSKPQLPLQQQQSAPPINRETLISQSTKSPSPVHTQNVNSQQSALNSPSTTLQGKQQYGFDLMLAKLIDLGFNADDAGNALRGANCDFDAAVELLLTKTSASTARRQDLAVKLSKLTGIPTKHTEKASKFLSSGLSALNKARSIVVDKLADNSRPQSRNGTFAANTRQEFSVSTSYIHDSKPGSRDSLKQVDLQPPQPTKNKRLVPKVYCSDEMQRQAEQFKLSGNDFIKKGQYGDAEAMYTKAIECLPEGHLNLIILLNNRAAARLKTGTYKECIIDCCIVEKMCMSELDLDDVADSQIHEYKDALSKACLRRATAYENIEHWEEAGKDYKKALEWNPNGKGAQDGIRRCAKATTSNIKSAENSTSAVIIEPTKPVNNGPKSSGLDDLSFLAQPAPSNAADESERVSQMRAQDAEKERIDAEKLELKDEIDARLLNWRSKNNLRAMLASLSTILWPEIRSDWKPVTMSELVTPNQVKVRYMKAIGKLHPDKLSSTRLTAEQQLLANGIFSALNDAWDLFKTQNGL